MMLSSPLKSKPTINCFGPSEGGGGKWRIWALSWKRGKKATLSCQVYVAQITSKPPSLYYVLGEARTEGNREKQQLSIDFLHPSYYFYKSNSTPLLICMPFILISYLKLYEIISYCLNTYCSVGFISLESVLRMHSFSSTVGLTQSTPKINIHVL